MINDSVALRPAIEMALERILRQPEFRVSPRLSAFLHYIVSETLAGRASRLKGYTIAVAVYGRDETFNPQTGSIVRVEALRLRRMLDAYNAGSGINDPAMIELPRGSYVPKFTARAQHIVANDNTAARAKLLPDLLRWKAAAVAGIAAGFVLGALWASGPGFAIGLEKAAAMLRGTASLTAATAAPSTGKISSQN